MKKLYILIIALFAINVVNGQSCLTNGITFTTQAQIDNFQTNYPNCTQIEGNTKIQGSDITNLNGLSVLTSIGGDLSIIFLDISSLTGLDNLTSVGGNLDIVGNDVLTNLTGLNNLTFIGMRTLIFYNSALTSLFGMGNVTSIGGYLWIEGTSSLINLQGMEGLTSIGEGLCLNNNSELQSLSGLENVTSIGGSLYFSGNDSLTDLKELNNIIAMSIDSLVIRNNGQLSSCETQNICDYLANPSGTIEIHDNAPGCNSQVEVEAACATMSVEPLTTNPVFTIYPNPASTKITIESSSKGLMTFWTISGQEILHQTITEQTTPIDIGSLPNGVYFVRLTVEKAVQVGKFVKN